MKSNLVPLFLFLSLLGFVYYADSNLMKLCDYVIEESQVIEDLFIEGSWDEALDLANDLKEYIESKTVLSSVYLNHCDFDELIDEAVELSIYIDCKDKTEAHVAAHSLKNYAKNIQHLHKPQVENIF